MSQFRRNKLVSVFVYQIICMYYYKYILRKNTEYRYLKNETRDKLIMQELSIMPGWCYCRSGKHTWSIKPSTCLQYHIPHSTAIFLFCDSILQV